MKKSSSIIRLIILPKINDDCWLCFAEGRRHIPFSLKRVYYILQAKPGLPRGAHAHYKTDQVLFCVQGSVRMVLDDGVRQEEAILDKPEVGVLIPKKVWHEMHDLKRDTVLLVLASRFYEKEDYIRNYKKFLKVVGHGK